MMHPSKKRGDFAQSGLVIFHAVIYIYIQSWPKISAPLQFCQKMQPFSQKIVAVANVLVLTFIFFCLHWNNTKKQRRKVKSDTIPHRTQKMHWTKLLAPLS